MAQVELRQVAKRFKGGHHALRDISLTIGQGEFLVIVGPSGSGKSTLLRLIAGLDTLSSGSLLLRGRPAEFRPPVQRDVAMVFQSPVLFPHLNVSKNIAFGLRTRGVPREEISGRVERAAGMLGLSDLLRRKPSQLSGGERQRVALARATAREAGIILLDEPLSNLDAPLRASTRADLIELHRRLGNTMVLVTHDQAEALALGDRVAVLQSGALVQVGTPREVYDQPATRFVAGFIGTPPMSLLPCRFERETRTLALDAPGSPGFRVPGDTRWARTLEREDRTPLILGVRAEHVTAQAPGVPTTPDVWILEAPLKRREPTGADTIATLALGEYELSLRVSNDLPLRPGEHLCVRLDPSRATCFDGTTGERIS